MLKVNSVQYFFIKSEAMSSNCEMHVPGEGEGVIVNEHDID